MTLPSILLLGKNLFYIFLGVFGVNFLVVIHELGHFLFCKLFNIKTPSFSIGFGPRIFEKKIGDTVFALSAIPFGGYVEIAGAQEVGQGDQELATSKENWAFSSKPYWQQLCVLLGGIAFNIIFAYIATSIIFFYGVPKTPLLIPKNTLPIVNEITLNSPASKAKIKPKDEIIAVNSKNINNDVASLLKKIQNNPNKTVNFTIVRDEQTIEIPVTLESKEVAGKPIGSLGASFELRDLPGLPPLKAIKEGFNTTNTLIMKIFQAFGNLLTRNGLKQVGGPLMIGWQLTKSAESSLIIFFLLLAFISINLAVLNVFPLPVLDGGQVLFYTIEAIIGRPLPEKVKLAIHYASWILMLMLLAFVFIKDLKLIFDKILK